jgi:outer membrane protein OmpA-like peptidoglycan-associated protein
MKKFYISLLFVYFIITTIKAQQVNLNKDLEAYYSMNGNGLDNSGNKHQSEVFETILSEDKKGRKGHCYRFNGKQDCYIDITKSKDLNFSNAFTISIWVYPEIVSDTNAQYTILSKLNRQINNTIVSGYEIRIYNGKLVLETSIEPSASASIEYLSQSSLQPFNWYNLIVTFTNGNLIYYINGKEDTSFIRGKLVSSTNIPIRIGNRVSTTDTTKNLLPYKGKMDELRFYQRALNEFEIKEIQNYDFEFSPLLLKDDEIEIRGRLIDEKSGKAIDGSLEFFKQGTNNEKITYHTSANGDYQVKGMRNSAYLYIVKANGYYSNSGQLQTFIPDAHNTIKMDFPLKPVEVGTPTIINNILFEQSKAELMPSSFVGLDKLYKLLSANPTLEIEVSGHTDNQGDESKNLILSQHRAEAVKQYLVNKGIAANRIIAKGYGSQFPIGMNDQEETRKLNRRVEYKIIKY